MGIILGGIITVVGTAPLSSMALTALFRFNRVVPMAIGAMAAFQFGIYEWDAIPSLKIQVIVSLRLQ